MNFLFKKLPKTSIWTTANITRHVLPSRYYTSLLFVHMVMFFFRPMVKIRQSGFLFIWPLGFSLMVQFVCEQSFLQPFISFSNVILGFVLRWLWGKPVVKNYGMAFKSGQKQTWGRQINLREMLQNFSEEWQNSNWTNVIFECYVLFSQHLGFVSKHRHTYFRFISSAVEICRYCH